MPCVLRIKGSLFSPSYVLGSDWVVLAAALHNMQPELSVYNFSTKSLQSCKGFLNNEEQLAGKLQVPPNVTIAFILQGF